MKQYLHTKKLPTFSYGGLSKMGELGNEAAIDYNNNFKDKENNNDLLNSGVGAGAILGTIGLNSIDKSNQTDVLGNQRQVESRWGTAGKGALQGTMVGSTLGPIGAGVGAVAGGAYGYLSNNEQQLADQQMQDARRIKGSMLLDQSNQRLNQLKQTGYNPTGNQYTKMFGKGGNITKLTEGQEIAYNRWIKNNEINESEDYDMRGYWKEKGYSEDKHTGHFDDTYKLLNYEPFSQNDGDGYSKLSEGSKYSGNPNYLTSYGDFSSTNTSFDKRNQGFWDNKDQFVEYAKGGKIHIKPSHKGRFTEYKERTGETTEEALHSKNTHVRKMAQFAKNFAHALGGNLYKEGQEYDLSEQEINKLKKLGYQLEY